MKGLVQIVLDYRPLDGTKEFEETGRTDWAVHVALAESGIPTAGAVAIPSIGTTFCSNDKRTIHKEILKCESFVAGRTWSSCPNNCREVIWQNNALGLCGAKQWR